MKSAQITKPSRSKRRSMVAKPKRQPKALPPELKQAITDIATRIEVLVWVPFERSNPPIGQSVLTTNARFNRDGSVAVCEHICFGTTYRHLDRVVVLAGDKLTIDVTGTHWALPRGPGP